jgi:large repetitive protein
MTQMGAGTRASIRLGSVAVIVSIVMSISAIPAQAGASPQIASFSPQSGPVGTAVTINGAGFGGAFSVAFNGTAATFNVNGPGTQITTAVPGGASTGPITVQTPNGSAGTTTFTVNAGGGGGPNITNFNPRSGPVGTSVTITGNTFSAVNAVRFNGTAAQFVINSSTQITATVPSGATTGRVSVFSPSGSDQSQGNFTVTGTNTPVITGFSPGSGKVGTVVSIFGSNFLGTTTVRFNATAALSFTVVNAGKITATVPNGATSGKISVTNAAGTGTSAGTFTVTGPKITSFSPSSGPVGTSVTLLGSNFTGVTFVRFNGTAASFTFVNDGMVTATVPAGATTGSITLTTPAGTATTSAFTVTVSVHGRAISLTLTGRGALRASGHVSVNDGYAPCQRFVPVVIKRFHLGRWRWVTTTSTQQDGDFRASLLNRSGKYRAKAKKIELVNGTTCGGRLSNVVTHHR